MKPIIYKFTNKINKKIYIGITNRGLDRRLEQHISSSKNPKTYFHKALHKYGIDNFIIEILNEVETYDMAKELEIKYIKQYDCFAPNGYNCTKGGDGQLGIATFKGKKHSKEECIRIGERSKNNKYCLGLKRTKEQKEAVSRAQTGRKRTPEEIYKMRVTKSKPIKCLTNNKEYINGMEAAKDLHLVSSDVYRVLSGKYKHTKGFKFEYLRKETKKVN